MAGEAEEKLEALAREAEALKQRLDEERQKLNDVTLWSVGERLEPVVFPSLKPRRVLKGHQSKVLCCDWAPDKRHLVSSSQDGKVVIWDAFLGTREACIATPSTWVLACAWAPAGGAVAAGGLDNKATVYAAEEPGRKRVVGTHAQYVSCLAFPWSARQLLTGGGDGHLALWDVESGALVAAWHAHAADVLALDVPRAPGAAAGSGAATFASGAGDRTARVWDVRSPRPALAFAHAADVNAVRWHPGGDALASGGDDAAARVWDLRAAAQLCELSRRSQVFACAGVEWSASGRLLLAAYHDHTAAAWDALRGSRLALLAAHDHRVSRIVRAPDGAALATASWDHTIRIWA